MLVLKISCYTRFLLNAAYAPHGTQLFRDRTNIWANKLEQKTEGFIQKAKVSIEVEILAKHFLKQLWSKLLVH